MTVDLSQETGDFSWIESHCEHGPVYANKAGQAPSFTCTWQLNKSDEKQHNCCISSSNYFPLDFNEKKWVFGYEIIWSLDFLVEKNIWFSHG